MGKLIKFIFFLVIVMGLAYGGLIFFGYEIHPENLQYYKPQDKYLDVIKKENKKHPLLTKKKGASAADSLGKTLDESLDTVMQKDKFETLDKLKKDVSKIQGISDDRQKQLDQLMAEG